jgi:hypothetical protein
MATSLSDIAAQLEHYHASVYLTLAGTTVMLYDWGLVLSDEIEYIWTGKFNLAKSLYISVRLSMPIMLAVDVYDKGGLARDLTTKFCKEWFVAEAVLTVISLAAVHWLVALRVIALLGNSALVYWGLFATFLGYLIATVVIFAYNAIDITSTLFVHPLLDICFGQIPHNYWVVWLPGIAYETLLFVMTVYKAITVDQSMLDAPILVSMFRGGFAHFCIIFLMSLFNLLVWSIAPPTLVLLAKYFTSATIVTAITRLVLDLRQAGDRARLTRMEHVSASLPVHARTADPAWELMPRSPNGQFPQEFAKTRVDSFHSP